MTDPELLAKKLAAVETYVGELRRLAHPEAIAKDLREERFIAHTLQLAVQAALDAASHIVADERLGEPSTNRELFTLLAGAGWIPQELAEALRRAVGLRNILVHGYEKVDLQILEDTVRHRLTDLLEFVERVRARLPR